MYEGLDKILEQLQSEVDKIDNNLRFYMTIFLIFILTNNLIFLYRTFNPLNIIVQLYLLLFIGFLLYQLRKNITHFFDFSLQSRLSLIEDKKASFDRSQVKELIFAVSKIRKSWDRALLGLVVYFIASTIMISLPGYLYPF